MSFCSVILLGDILFSVILFCVILFSVILLSDILFSVILFSVILFSVILLNVNLLSYIALLNVTLKSVTSPGVILLIVVAQKKKLAWGHNPDQMSIWTVRWRPSWGFSYKTFYYGNFFLTFWFL